jgi:hypothetical protein
MVRTEATMRISEIGRATRLEIRKYVGKVRKCHQARGEV